MITVTPAARKRLQKQTQKARQFGVHIDVIRSGCSGFSYQLALVDGAESGQESYPEDGFHLIVDAEDIPLLAGVTLDLKKQGLNESLVFDNPNASATCGCGSSFSL